MEWLFYLIIFIFVIISAYYSGTETAVISANTIKLQTVESVDKKYKKTARKILKLIENPDRTLSALLVGTNLAVVGATSFTSMLFIRKFGENGEFYATIVMTIVLLIFGEILPKAIFRKTANHVLLYTGSILDLSVKIFTPIINLILIIISLFPFIKYKERKKKRVFMTRDDLKSLFRASAKEGEIGELEEKIFTSVFDFGRTFAREVMTPLVDIVSIEKSKKVKDAVKLSMRTGFSRIPVFEKYVYNITGYVYVLDFMEARGSEPLKKYIRDPYYVPETKKIDDLFFEMNQKRLPLVFVVDEYGGVSGLITMEDIAEEIVGEIRDSTDNGEVEKINEIKTGEWIVRGDLDIDDLFEEINLSLPKHGYETVAGFIEFYLGRIPKKNESFVYNNYKFIILESTPRSIEKIKIKRLNVKRNRKTY